MWEYCPRRVGWCWRRKGITIRLWQKGGRGEMKAYVWMSRISHLMTSVTMEKVIKIVVLPGSMQQTVLE